ncbi:MAG: hypothetical protein ACOYL3_10575 [Desulfuromonadaceae bacterium]
MGIKIGIIVVSLSFLVGGCAAIEGSGGYSRPELFHPETARTVERLKDQHTETRQQKADQAVSTPATSEEGDSKGTIILAGKLELGSSDVPITIMDESCAAGQFPDIAVIDGANKVGSVKQEGKSASLIIDATSLTGNYVSVEFKLCGQEGKIRKKYPVQVPPLKIIGPEEKILVKDQSYKISVYDECPVGVNPVVRFDPPDSGVFSAQNGNYWDYVIDTSKAFLPHGTSVQITAQSCRATRVTPEQIETVGLLKKAKYQVVKPEYQGVTAKLVVWSYEDTASEFGKIFAESFYAADAVFVNRTQKSMLVYGSSLTAHIRFLPSIEDMKKVYSEKAINAPSVLYRPDEKGKTIAERINWKEPWRPMCFSDVLAIFTYQQESAPRKRNMELLKSLGVLLTGATVFTPGIDYVKGVAFFTGVFNPELEKQLLWDVLLHVKNIEARAMKEIEEIKPNGQLRKAVFFPRRAIYGVLPEIPVYISEIRPDPANVLVTIIEKEATVEAKAGD